MSGNFVSHIINMSFTPYCKLVDKGDLQQTKNYLGRSLKSQQRSYSHGHNPDLPGTTNQRTFSRFKSDERLNNPRDFPFWQKKFRNIPILKSFLFLAKEFCNFPFLALFRYSNSPQILLCKKKIPHHIKMSAHIWSTKYRWNQKLIAQFCCTLRDEYFKPN
jgi:hypothetical protein